MRIKRFFTFAAVLIILSVQFSFSSCDDTSYSTTILACSDFQNPDGHLQGKETVEEILYAIKQSGIDSADGFFCCGDYDIDYTHNADGILTLDSAVSNMINGEKIFIQGNHDDVIGAHGMALSGDNDPDHGKYGVYVINEDDYMWYNEDEQRIKQTADHLTEYFDAKIKEEYKQPVFVLSHLPLHYSMRTKNNGDAMHANYIFNAVNDAADKGLSIFFLYGHDHSNGWDDYLGGSCVYLKKGDEINIAQSSKDYFLTEKLNFTYFNPGYVGYYSNVNGADDTLTMSVITITDDEVEITRYSKDGVHALKSEGVRNSYKNEFEYEPNEKLYPSPQIVALK